MKQAGQHGHPTTERPGCNRLTYPTNFDVGRAAFVDEPSEAFRVGHVPLAQIPEHLELVAEADFGPGDGLIVRPKLVSLGRATLVLLPQVVEMVVQAREGGAEDDGRSGC